MKRTEERRRCPTCQSPDARPCGSKNEFDIFVCQACSTIFTLRLPAGEETEDYDAYYTEANLTVQQFVIARLHDIITGFEPHRSTSRLLDIGFGSGVVLEAAKELGWEVFGTEVSMPAVEQAKSRGFPVHHGPLASAAYPDDHFDVVVASEILEHLIGAESELSEIQRILRPGGVFWGTTPSATSLSFRTMGSAWSIVAPPEHTQIYSKTGVRHMLARVGFSKVRIQTLGLNPGKIANYYRRDSPGRGKIDRVGTGYQLNEQLTGNPVGRLVKGTVNLFLNPFALGASLKILAQKAPAGR